MKIIVVHDGPDYEILLLTSILIGLKKKYNNSKILWVGDPRSFCLIKYNKRVKKCLNVTKVYDLAATDFYKSELCVNISSNTQAQRFASICEAQEFAGFDANGPVNRSAEFFQKIVNNNLKTNKTILDLCYSLIDVKWKGEGYGLGYYPRKKQSKECGVFLQETSDEGEIIELPDELLAKFDTLNQFAHIITDDLFVLHAGLALRKKVTFQGDLPYKPNFT